jgi:hypothetical protein
MPGNQNPGDRRKRKPVRNFGMTHHCQAEIAMVQYARRVVVESTLHPPSTAAAAKLSKALNDVGIYLVAMPMTTDDPLQLK